VAEQDSVDVPEPPVILVGVSEQVKPVCATLVRLTVPVNPLRGVTVIVDDAAVPVVVLTGLGLAVIVKSLTAKLTVVEAELVPLVPVTVTT
jgi:hypothetical protein